MATATTTTTAIVRIQNALRGPYTLWGPAGEEIRTCAEPVPAAYKWLTGDCVDPETGAIHARSAAHKQIVGIVDFLNRTGYGFTARNVPLYLFHPLDPAYPPMVVASKTRHTQNKVAVASFEHWDGLHPRAGIQRLLGSVGDRDVEQAALLLWASGGGVASTGEETATATATAAHETHDWDHVCNIDPAGCIDVDDVLCWKRVDDTTVRFAIAIADAAAWVPEGSALDTAAAARGQTLYRGGLVHTPMLPTSLSSESASLRADGVPRPALGLVYTIREGRCVDVAWKELMLVVNAAYTYKSVYDHADVCAQIRGCLEAIGCDVAADDSHQWIEQAMLEYNRRAAECLQAATATATAGGIFRNHAGRPQAFWAELSARTGIRELAWFGASGGSYGLTSDGHAGLGAAHYVHASSPLRRYADLVNQRWLKHVCFGHAPRPAAVGAACVAHLNERVRVAKTLDRTLWFLGHFDATALSDAEGYVIAEKGDGVWTVYVPAWKQKLRGKCEEGAALTVGQRVHVSVYTNLRAPSFHGRYVCRISGAACA